METTHQQIDEVGEFYLAGESEYVARTLDTVRYAFQPIVDFDTGVVYGHEALIRNVDQLGFSCPADLLTHAAQHNYLADLEPQLLMMALEYHRKFQKACGSKLFFNVDGRGLGLANDPRMDLTAIVRANGHDPSQICLELSENHQDNQSGLSDHILKNLRRDGFMLALDHFGQGFSELRLIHDLGPQYIKIDHFFLKDIDKDPRQKLFVTTVANLAHVLGARVIAGGVETEGEFKACRDAGCDLVQGYYVARPFTDKSHARLFYDHIRTDLAQNKKTEEERKIKEGIQTLPSVSSSASISELVDLFIADQNLSLLPVLDTNSEPRGLIHERDLKAYLYAAGFADEGHKLALDLPLHNFIRSCPIADINSDIDTLLVTFASSLSSDGIIITEDFRYAGFLSATSLLKILQDKRLEEAQDQNPLTGLPGNGAIRRYIDKAAHARSTARHFCYFDFDNFKPFNDTYGYPQGDRVITLFSELMQRHICGIGTFCGHIGGDDFFAGFMMGEQDEIAERLLTLKRAFKSDVESFYAPEHRKQGYIQASDRYGAARTFALLDCSISMITVEPETGLPVDRINTEIASLKRAAKRSDDGFVVKTLAA
ncbi:EAL domain-containing protein [Roseibium polysiphoniae]|uniref:GGDEF domain-containing protein n=1 Tax=Roseibium polysiphoniae TaxID=2571221 RepID=UPI003297785B